MTQQAPVIVVSELAVMSEAVWSFSDERPKWRHRRHGSCGTFDPFPAYPHDLAVVREAVAHVQARFAPLWDVELFVADREEEGRSNGYSNMCHDGHYEGEKWVTDPPVGLIMLSGKRVPPHPAMTRYLVAHEYGHHVEWMLNDARGARHAQDDTLVREYVKLRGLSDDNLHHGSGGRWHNSVHEILACDFRIVVCDVETEFWPHPGIPHPRDLSLQHDLFGWWADALAAAQTRQVEAGAA